MELVGQTLAAVKGFIGAEGLIASIAVALVGGFLLLTQLRGMGREDRSGETAVKTGEQATSFQERLLAALERSQEREKLLADRVDQLVAEKAETLEELGEVRVELGLLRNQLRNVYALLRQVRDGAIAPAAIEIPDSPPGEPA